MHTCSISIKISNTNHQNNRNFSNASGTDKEMNKIYQNSIAAHYSHTMNRNSYIKTWKYEEVNASTVRSLRLKFFNKQIAEYAKRLEIEKCMKILKGFENEGINPNAYSYNPILNQLLKLNKEKEFYELLGEMEGKGVKRDQFTYSFILNFYVQKENEEMICAVLKEMKASEINPDFVIFNILLNFYLKIENEMMVHFVLEHMKGEGCKPTRATNNVVLDLLINLGREEDARAFFNSVFVLDYFVNKEGLNVHGLSRGAAYAATLNFIESHWKGDSFILITGQGIHSHHSEPFAMRDILEKKIKEKYSNLDCQIMENKGCLKITRKIVNADV